MRIWAVMVFLHCASASAASIGDLGWLTGCWSYDGQVVGSGEHWLIPAGQTMFGVSRSVRDSKTVAFEYLRIEQTDDSSLALFASPSGQNTTRFDLIQLGETEAVFENPAHDFPQRIIYRLRGNSLLGRIEGKSDGKEVAVDFPMTRSACDDGLREKR